MKLLAIDTSMDYCSAALLLDGEVYLREQLAPRQHAQILLGMIESLLLESTLKLKDLDVIAFAGGPASFTGVRIAASVVQALAFAAELPVIRVSTLQTIAQGILTEKNNENIIVALDAFMGEIYWGIYQAGNDELVLALEQDTLIKPGDVKLPAGDWVGVGNAWEKYPDLIQLKIIYSAQPSAKYVAKLAAKKWQHNEVLKPEEAVPVYLRGKDAWRKSTKL